MKFDRKYKVADDTGKIKWNHPAGFGTGGGMLSVLRDMSGFVMDFGGLWCCGIAVLSFWFHF